MLQNSNASPILGFTASPFLPHSDNSFHHGTALIFPLAVGNTVSPPSSTSDLNQCWKWDVIYWTHEKGNHKWNTNWTYGKGNHLTDTSEEWKSFGLHSWCCTHQGSNQNEHRISVQLHNGEFEVLLHALEVACRVNNQHKSTSNGWTHKIMIKGKVTSGEKTNKHYAYLNVCLQIYIISFPNEHLITAVWNLFCQVNDYFVAKVIEKMRVTGGVHKTSTVVVVTNLQE